MQITKMFTMIFETDMINLSLCSQFWSYQAYCITLLCVILLAAAAQSGYACSVVYLHLKLFYCCVANLVSLVAVFTLPSMTIVQRWQLLL